MAFDEKKTLPALQWAVKAYSAMVVLENHPDVSDRTRKQIEILVNDAPEFVKTAGALNLVTAYLNLAKNS